MIMRKVLIEMARLVVSSFFENGTFEISDALPGRAFL